MTDYRAEEFFQFAIKIERDGKTFYEKLADVFEGELRAFFEHMARQEDEHENLFERMVHRLNRYTPEEFYTDEYFTYLHALTNSDVFSLERLEQEQRKLRDLPSAVDFALHRERESIRYYDALAKWVHPSDMHLIDSIIDEERNHIQQLESLLESYHANGTLEGGQP